MTHDPDSRDPVNPIQPGQPSQLAPHDEATAPTPGVLPGAPMRRPPAPVQYMTAELCIGARRIYVRGRILGIVLWLITHQDKVNYRTASAGQLWLTWKDGDPLAVEGEIKTKL